MALSRYALLIFLIMLAVVLASRQGKALPLNAPHQGPTLMVGKAKINIELATTPAEQERGLGNRISLAPNAGMLFVYATDTVPFFWMRDMHFPLDIIWLDRNAQIVGYSKNLAPSTYPQTVHPNEAIRYVLEVNAGFVDKQQLKIGDKAYN